MDKSIKKVQNTSAKELSTIVFPDSFHFYFLSKKSERIAAAIHLVTNLIKDDDAIKWQLRKRSLDLVSDSLAFHYLDLSDKRHAKKVHGLISELLSLLEIGCVAQVVSEMNSAVLRRELSLLLELIEAQMIDGGMNGGMSDEDGGDEDRDRNQAVPMHHSLILSDDFFALPQTVQENLKGHDKGHSDSNHNKMSFINPPSHSKIINKIIPQRNQDSFQKQDSLQKGQDRKSLILSIFNKSKDQKDISVGDLKDLISGYSEKTLQRDLIAMVKEGVLKKSGERRWSRYGLA